LRDDIKLKLEIWRDEKLDMVEDIKEEFERSKDSGIFEMLNA